MKLTRRSLMGKALLVLGGLGISGKRKIVHEEGGARVKLLGGRYYQLVEGFDWPGLEDTPEGRYEASMARRSGCLSTEIITIGDECWKGMALRGGHPYDLIYPVGTIIPSGGYYSCHEVSGWYSEWRKCDGGHGRPDLPTMSDKGWEGFPYWIRTV